MLFSALLFSPLISFGQNKANLYFFYTNTCLHCAQEKIFLEKLEKEYPDLEIKRFEVGENRDNLSLMADVGKALKIETGSVPLTIIGKKVFIGYLDDENTGAMIREAVDDCVKNACSDEVIKIIQKATPVVSPPPESGLGKIKIPILGEFDPKAVSLPILTVVIGGLDGFNPCAMWILFFLISLLLGMENRKRMWILGGVFILTSAFVYFMFMAAWLNIFLFLGLVWWVRLIVGFVAIGSGLYYLKKYFKKEAEVCEISRDVKKQKILEKLKAVTLEKKFYLALIGIIMLAGAVNLFELLCSAGFPAIYTKVLSMNNLPMWQYYGYLLLYIFMFMLDDMLVFAIAMLTLQTVVFGRKYNKISILVGGLFMLAIGFLLLFRPEILSFRF
jgi:thiol-disulfide isomerase/thioredoxin